MAAVRRHILAQKITRVPVHISVARFWNTSLGQLPCTSCHTCMNKGVHFSLVRVVLSSWVDDMSVCIVIAKMCTPWIAYAYWLVLHDIPCKSVATQFG